MSSLIALVVACSISALATPLEGAPASEPPAREAELDLGIDIIGLWGGALRVGYHGHHGWLDMVGLRMGYAAGPSPLFGGERVVGAVFAAPTVDLFPDQNWQLELTFGPAALDHDDGGDATVAFDEGWGFVAGLAGRYKTERAFQINLGPMLLADYRVRQRVVVVDIGPSWVW